MSEATISHRPEAQRFDAALDGLHGHLDYAVTAGVMTISHTEVDPALAGRGVGGALVAAALAWAGGDGLKVNPTCPYAESYMQRHPESMSLHA